MPSMVVITTEIGEYAGRPLYIGEEVRTLEGNHSQVVPGLELNLHVRPFSSGVDGPLN